MSVDGVLRDCQNTVHVIILNFTDFTRRDIDRVDAIFVISVQPRED